MQEAEFLSHMRSGYPAHDTTSSRVDFVTEGESPGPWSCDPEDKSCIVVQIPSKRPAKSNHIAGDVPISIETYPQLHKRRPSVERPGSWHKILQTFKAQNEKVKETSHGINKLKNTLEGKRMH